MPRIVNLGHLTQGAYSAPSSVTRADTGETIKICCGIYTHYGIADGADGVIHASKKYGKVVHTSWKEFSNEQSVYICHDIKSNDSLAAYEKAKARIDQPYNLFSANCEQFVCEVHGVLLQSSQVGTAIRLTTGSTAIMAKKPMTKAASAGAYFGSSINKKNPAAGAVIGGIIGALVGACWSDKNSSHSSNTFRD